MKRSALVFALGLVAVALLGGCGGPPPPPQAVSAIEASWTALRTWTSADGRKLEASLAARMGEDGVVRRSVDGVPLRLPPKALNEEDKKFLQTALNSGKIPSKLADTWYVRTRLTIPGGEAFVAPDTVAAIGPRIAKVETSYWLLLTELDGTEAKWVRVDSHAFTKQRPDTLLLHTELATQMNGSGRFIDEVPCPRTNLYVLDARYGLTSRRVNVTRAMMGHLAAGTLPMTVGPEIFGMPSHSPDVWDVAITWQRTGDGTLNRIVRDGSILAWP